MSKSERIIGNIMAILLGLLVAYAILSSIFSLLFRDGRGVSLYGTRGEFYMEDHGQF